MVQDESKICLVCGEEYPGNRIEGTEYFLLRYFCDRCGRYYVSVELQLMYKANPPWLEIRHLLSAWIRRENDLGITPTIDNLIIEADWERFKHMGFPDATIDKLNSLLLAYVDEAKGDYQQGVPSESS